MSRHTLSASDLRPLLRMAEELQLRRPFSQSLTILLSVLCELTDSSTAIAYEVEFGPGLKQIARPLQELVRRGPDRLPQRSNLAGAASISRYALAALERPVRVVANFGRPIWGNLDPALQQFHDAKRLLHGIQFLNSESLAIGVVLTRPARQEPFLARERMILDMTLRSHRFYLRTERSPAVSLAM